MNFVNVLFFVGKQSKSVSFWIDDVENVERFIQTYYPKATDVVVVDAVEADKVDFDDYIGERSFALAGSKQYVNNAVNRMYEYDKKIEQTGRPDFLKFGECEVVQVGGLYALYF